MSIVLLIYLIGSICAIDTALICWGNPDNTWKNVLFAILALGTLSWLGVFSILASYIKHGR